MLTAPVPVQSDGQAIATRLIGERSAPRAHPPDRLDHDLLVPAVPGAAPC